MEGIHSAVVDLYYVLGPVSHKGVKCMKNVPLYIGMKTRIVLSDVMCRMFNSRPSPTLMFLMGLLSIASAKIALMYGN